MSVISIIFSVVAQIVTTSTVALTLVLQLCLGTFLSKPKLTLLQLLQLGVLLCYYQVLYFLEQIF